MDILNLCSVTDMCFMCTNENDCKVIDEQITSQIQYLMPEITIIKLDIPLRICSFCDEKLHSFNQFKHACLRNSQRMESNIRTIQNKGQTAQASSAMETELQAVGNTACEAPGTDDNNFEEIFIKEEPLDDNLEFESGEEQNMEAEESLGDMCPKKSQERYEKEFKDMKSWMTVEKVETITEPVLLSYFNRLSSVYKCSSLWSKYSMLKKMLIIKENVNIGSYKQLISFLKSKSVGHEPKKAMVLSKDNIIKFMTESPDCIYLMIKIALLFGIYGACRREELANIKVDDVDDRGSVILVTIPKTKTHKRRQFGIVDDEISALTLCRKYIALRPANISHRRFFLQFRNQMCTSQPVGKNTFGAIPKTIAKYLQLPNAERYTGHTFRRTSATLLADSGMGVGKVLLLPKNT